MRLALVVPGGLLSLLAVSLVSVNAQAAEVANLVLDGEEYALEMEVCDFSGDADDRYQTLVARADTDRGPLRVFASRNEVAGMLTHSISAQFGDFRAGGEVLEANRTRMGGQWISVAGGASEPLIRIDGGELHAEGRFVDTGMTTEPVDGRLTASCDRR
ncbi:MULTISPECIES: hypothetical protein [unclassified Thioalkalivibrio]|uniref:hypothetical protein n=1 Tax=unclassified Thioalkalivibrio TaxID=2621013 RepID=UPI0003A70C24|nr:MULTISPECIES: hypothetical protein [unclassified Thioalkalivibrio]